MVVTFILRLLPDRLAKGEVVGEVESVGDGEHAFVRDADALVSFAQRAAASSGDPVSRTPKPR